MEIQFFSYDNKQLYSELFEAENPCGVIQIVHGMQEHSGRYKDFVNFLVKNGYNVFICDQRGHGKTAITKENLGYSDGDIYKECVNDQLYISKYIKEKYPSLPLYVIGHSFGSFVTQGYILQNKYAEKIILSGSAYNNTMLFKAGKVMAKTIQLFKGRKGSAKFIENLSFGSYGKKFEGGNWLTRNKEIFTAYQNDEYCGTPFPISFYVSMFTNTPKNYKNLKKVENKAKIFIISGTDDPVGEFGKSIVKLSRTYQKAGFKIATKLYKDYRHEVLNELNKTEVYNDIINFLKTF